MTITADDVALELGVATPTALQQSQWTKWIGEALYLIGRRYDVNSLNPQDVDYVVLHAVVAHARNPRNATQVDIKVDDGSVSKRYESGSGRVTISDDLWDMLGDEPTPDGAFTVRPAYVPDCGPLLRRGSW